MGNTHVDNNMVRDVLDPLVLTRRCLNLQPADGLREEDGEDTCGSRRGGWKSARALPLTSITSSVAPCSSPKSV
jgi:hypothetical protein